MPVFSWTTDIDEAKSEQRSMRELVRLETAMPESLDFDQGIAIGTSYEPNTKRAFAVAVPFDRDGEYSGVLREVSVVVDFPYIPGLLAFRVGPAICAVLDAIIDRVDFLLIDGQGIAHQRGLGLAAHIGVLYDKPTIGVTRNNLFGKYDGPPSGRFNYFPLRHPKRGYTIGYALSLGERCQPLYLSPGHRMSLEDSLRMIRKISGENTCFPRPLQKAHTVANAAARKFWKRQKHIASD